MTHRLVLAGSAAAVLAGACGSTSASDRPVPPPPPEVAVTLQEYEIKAAEPVPSGRVVFRIVNRGALEHEVTLVPLGEDVPPVAEQIRSGTPSVVTPLARVPPRRPGQEGLFAVELAPGQRYAMVCYVRNPDGKAHANLGMSWEVRAGPASGAGTGG